MKKNKKLHSVFDFCGNIGITRGVYRWALVKYCDSRGIKVDRVYNDAGTQARLFISEDSLIKFMTLWTKERVTTYDRSTYVFKARDLIVKKCRDMGLK